MMNNSKIGVALVGGYLLGRTRKAKMAIGLGMVLAGKRLNLTPQQLAKMAANSPVIGGLSEQVRNDLLDNTKSALTSAVTRRAGSLADSLHERTLDINDPGRRAHESGEAGDDDTDDADVAEVRAAGRRDRDDEDDEDTRGDAREDAHEDAREDARDEPPQARGRSAARGGGSAKSTKPAAGRKPATRAEPASGAKSSASKAASGDRGTARSGAGKTAASRARKTGGARRTAAEAAPGGTRKTTKRGGDDG